VVPTNAKYGDIVRVTGKDFFPLGVTVSTLKVYLSIPGGGVYILASVSPYVNNTGWSDNTITFQVSDSIYRTGQITVGVENKLGYWQAPFSMNSAPTSVPSLPAPSVYPTITPIPTPQTFTPTSTPKTYVTPTLYPTITPLPTPQVFTPTSTPKPYVTPTAYPMPPTPTPSIRVVVVPTAIPTPILNRQPTFVDYVWPPVYSGRSYQATITAQDPDLNQKITINAVSLPVGFKLNRCRQTIIAGSNRISCDIIANNVSQKTGTTIRLELRAIDSLGSTNTKVYILPVSSWWRSLIPNLP
jgi:hypothetical protein